MRMVEWRSLGERIERDKELGIGVGNEDRRLCILSVFVQITSLHS